MKQTIRETTETLNSNINGNGLHITGLVLISTNSFLSGKTKGSTWTSLAGLIQLLLININ